jgi:hypothetical protein
MSERESAASVACHRNGCGHPIESHNGSEWGEPCSECPCPDYWSGKSPLHDCDEDGICAPDCRTCAQAKEGGERG